MKRIVVLFLAVLFVVTTAACASGNSNTELIKEIEKIFPELDKLPIDLDEAMKQARTEGTKYTSNSTGETSDDLLAVFDGCVLYSTDRTKQDITDGGIHFSYTITTLHIGQSKALADHTLEIQFVAALLQMSIASDDVASAKEYLKNLTKGAPVNEKEYGKFIDGEKIYITSDSFMWDSYVRVDEKMKISYDSENRNFAIKFVGELGVLYHDTIRDEEERVLSDIAYYYDENGNKWIETEEVNSYTDKGASSKKTYYYPNSNQVSKYMERGSGEGDLTVRLLKEIEYYENGNLKREYYNHSQSRNEEKYTVKAYAEDGSLTDENICNDEGTFRATYQNGVKVYSYRSVNGRTHEDSYYPNGNLKNSLEYIGNEINHKNVWDKSYYENGNPSRIDEFYESGRIKIICWYYEETGTVQNSKEFYDMNGEILKEELVYDIDGNITSREAFDENGSMIEPTK